MIIFITLVVIFMLALSALLSATETSITASSYGTIHKFKTAGYKNADLVLDILKVKEQVISTMLIINTIMNIIATTIATSLFIVLTNDKQLGPFISSIVMSFFIIIFAEVIPKAIAVAKAERILLLTAPIILVFLKIFNPINSLLNIILRWFCIIFRINLSKEVSGTEEVRGIIAHQHYEGNVYKSDRDMLEGILDIRNMEVSEIMIHRSQMIAINADLPNETILKYALSSPNTRIPLWKNQEDNIIGILHIKDLLKTLYINNNEIAKLDIKSVLTKPWFIPEQISVSDQLKAFRENRNHFACVIDEYGDLQGIITLEDILEEIVGQIHDEHDKVYEAIIKNSDTEFIIDGTTTIRDINKELNWQLPDDDATTISGLIINNISRIPNQGEMINIFDLKITIMKKIANRIKTVKCTLTKHTG